MTTVIDPEKEGYTPQHISIETWLKDAVTKPLHDPSLVQDTLVDIAANVQLPKRIDCIGYQHITESVIKDTAEYVLRKNRFLSCRGYCHTAARAQSGFHEYILKKTASHSLVRCLVWALMYTRSPDYSIRRRAATRRQAPYWFIVKQLNGGRDLIYDYCA